MSTPVTATLFYKSAYPGVVAHFATLPSPLPLDVAFTARSYLALQPPQTNTARSLIAKHAQQLGENTSRAYNTFADVIDHVAATADDESQRDLGTLVGALSDINESVTSGVEQYDGESEQVQVLLATAQHLDSDPLGALETLSMGTATQRNLGSLALGVHLLLLNHRLDLAQKEYDAARSWAEDSLVIQLIEASLGLYKGGRAAQQAYYVYDEFASLSSTSIEGKEGRLAAMKLGRGVGLMRRSEWQKAEESLREASTLLQQSPSGAADGLRKDTEANLAVLALHLNPASKLENPGQEHLSNLEQPAPAHTLSVSISEMGKRFDELVADRAVAATS
ncbi:unnamed protein product [Jaminaea pallidilutea]